MKERYRKLPARFGPETGFGVRVGAPAPFRARQEAEFEQLKAQLLQERSEQRGRPEGDLLLERAANDAAALAWVTQYPLLVFPALFAEKADAALLRAQRQDQILQRSRELLVA